MNKRVWAIGGALLAVLVLIGGTSAFLLSRLDARGEIERQIEAATGRDVVIAGPVRISFPPNLGFRAEQVSLASVAGTREPHLLKTDALIVGVGARALLNRRLEVHELRLVNPTLNLELDARGAPNWILGPKPAPRSSSPAPKPGGQTQDVALHGVRMENGRISFLNRKAGADFLLTEANIDLALESLDRPLEVKGEAKYAGEPVVFDVTVAAVRAAMSGASTPLTLRLQSAPVEAAFEGAVETKSGDLTGALKASGPNLRALARWAGQSISDGPGFAAFSVDGKVNLTAKSMAFDNASITLDAIRGRGDLLIETGRAKPFLSGRLELTAPLDLNPYLMPAASAPGGAQPAAAEAPSVAIAAVDVTKPGWSQARIDLSGLRQLDANIELTTQRLSIQKIAIDRAQGMVVLSDGFLAAALNEFAMYGGKGVGRVEINARGAETILRHQLDVSGLSAEPFLKDAVGFTQLSGTAILKLDLTAKGPTQDAMMKSMSGTLDLRLKDGGLRGVDLGGLSRTIGNALNGQMVSENARTPFKDFAVTFRVVDGVAATRDLRIRAEDAEVSAAGVIDIGNRRIDMRVTPKAESFLSRLGGPFKGAGVVFPFQIAGPWDKATYASDLRGRAKAAIDMRVAAILNAPRIQPTSAPAQ